MAQRAPKWTYFYTNGLYHSRWKDAQRKEKKEGHNMPQSVDRFINKLAYNNKLRVTNPNGTCLGMRGMKEDAIKKFADCDTFRHLWQQYVDSDFKKGLNPSMDRLDNTKGYYPENLQWVTWDENQRLYRIAPKGVAHLKKGSIEYHSAFLGVSVEESKYLLGL